MLDITKPLVTTLGDPVTILSDKARVVTSGHSYPLIGYIEDSHVPCYWDAEGNAASPGYHNIQYKAEQLYINLYRNGNVGVFKDRKLAQDAQANALTSLSISYIPGEKQF